MLIALIAAAMAVQPPSEPPPAVAPAAEAAPAPLDVLLECPGTADQLETTNAFGRVGNDSASITTFARDRSDEIVRIDIQGGSGRIFVPRSLRPGLRSGGDEGWWEFNSIDVQPERIEARFTMNFAVRPKVVINRLTGDIDLAAFGGSFSGVCRPQERTAQPLF